MQKAFQTMQTQNQVGISAFLPRALQLTILSSALASVSFFQTALPAFAADPVVCLNTTKGPIYIRIFVNMVPNTAGAFLDLVQRGFYSGSAFHRVEDFCIQGGGPGGNPNGVFVHESGQVRRLRLEINRNLSHSGPGVVAMARTQDRNSASCQFYITKKQSRFLDGNYAIFGGVVQGMNTVYSIQRGDGILSAEIVSSGEEAPPPQQQVEEPVSQPPPRPRRGGRNSGQQVPQSKPADSGF